MALIVALCGISCTGEGHGAGERVPDSEAAQPPQRSVDTARVTLEEYAIGMPPVLSAGANVLRLESLGFEEHNLLFFLGPSDSLVWETERRLSPYETRVVTLNLPPGSYTVVCDFSGHEGRGMFTDLLVQPASAASP